MDEYAKLDHLEYSFQNMHLYAFICALLRIYASIEHAEVLICKYIQIQRSKSKCSNLTKVCLLCICIQKHGINYYGSLLQKYARYVSIKFCPMRHAAAEEGTGGKTRSAFWR